MWPPSIAWREKNLPFPENLWTLVYGSLFKFRTYFYYLEAGNFSRFLIQLMRMIHVLFDVVHFNWSRNCCSKHRLVLWCNNEFDFICYSFSNTMSLIVLCEAFVIVASTVLSPLCRKLLPCYILRQFLSSQKNINELELAQTLMLVFGRMNTI